MSLKKLVTGLLLCLCFNSFIHGSSYKGFVKDDSGNALEFVNVTLHSLNDSIFINGTVTDKAGYFELGKQNKPVFLKLSSIGFEDRIIENPDTCLMDIELSTAT
ncbi:MAG: carboxypeptidase-like regulatory domain-containing protein, partial [Muribaculaceae bacterium]|nr:carboxypeptidase-like regulatory domain-containing protein [Muribaculaceae bacterium]